MPKRILVAFDVGMVTRTKLHKSDHPVQGADDAFLASVSDAPHVQAALNQFGHDAQLLPLDLKTAPSVLARVEADLVFNLCDTLGGQSAPAVVVPAILEARGIPFVGATAAGLALSKRKHDIKAVLEREGLPTPRAQVIRTVDEVESFELQLVPPVILKLSAEHSSIGLDAKSVCFDEADVKAVARRLLERHQQPVLLEEYVDGREFYVSLAGDPAKTLPMMEHSFEELPAGFLKIRTFDMKWFSDPTRSGDAPPTDERWSQPVPQRDCAAGWAGSVDDIPAVCARAFEVCGLRDWGRLDLRLDRGGVPHLIDVTPNTFLGPSAPCVRAAASADIEYAELIAYIAQGALNRGS